MKIGITFNGSDKLFSNGINYNVFLWYDFLRLCGFTPYLINGSDKNDEKAVETIIENFNRSYRCVKYNSMKHSEFIKLDIFKELKLVFCIGLSDTVLFDLLRKTERKIIYIMLGNTYKIDVQNILDDKQEAYGCLYTYDEVWISKHFEYSKDYLEVRYKSKVYVCPYLWEPWLLDTFEIKDKIKKIDNISVGIVEPNINYGKTCLMPISLCEVNEKDIDDVYVFGSRHLKEKKMLVDFTKKLELFKKKKISFENRIKMTSILTDLCNVIVSTTEDWDLNYVFLECFYYGVPLVHNSEYLKDYGYYYPNLEIKKSEGIFRKIKNEFNREKYIEDHKEVLFKYSVNNPVNQAWVKHQISKFIKE